MNLPQLPQLRPRERLLAVGSGIIILILVLDSAVLRPWLRHGAIVRQQIHEMEESLGRYQRLLVRAPHVMAELGHYQQYLQPAIAPELQMAVFIKELEQLASQSHITLQDTKALPPAASPLSTRYTVELRFACTLEQWVELVYQIETSPSLYEISRAALSVAEDSPDKLQGSLRVMAVVLNPSTNTSDAREESQHPDTRRGSASSRTSAVPT